MLNRTYRVAGHVQGVGFRWWTRSQATELGVRGTVCNQPDGSVEVRAVGSEEALGQLRRRLARGPSGARVSSVEEADGEAVKVEGFHIIPA